MKKLHLWGCQGFKVFDTSKVVLERTNELLRLRNKLLERKLKSMEVHNSRLKIDGVKKFKI